MTDGEAAAALEQRGTKRPATEAAAAAASSSAPPAQADPKEGAEKLARAFATVAPPAADAPDDQKREYWMRILAAFNGKLPAESASASDVSELSALRAQLSEAQAALVTQQQNALVEKILAQRKDLKREDVVAAIAAVDAPAAALPPGMRTGRTSAINDPATRSQALAMTASIFDLLANGGTAAAPRAPAAPAAAAAPGWQSRDVALDNARAAQGALPSWYNKKA